VEIVPLNILRIPAPGTAGLVLFTLALRSRRQR
jgi:hypothetical protein